MDQMKIDSPWKLTTVQGSGPFPSQEIDVSGIKRKWLDIPYADQSPNQKLDIFLPDEGEGPFPVYIFMHGGAYLFGAGSYVFFGTLFELLGVQAVTAAGRSVSLPAPLSDINGAIAVGVTSFTVILLAGLFTGGLRGMLKVLKDFSLPVSMSFRLFGSLLSGLLVTELVYHYMVTSFVVPVLVGVLFTLLHALIQTFVLCTLVSVFYGEAVEPMKKRKKKEKKENKENQEEVAS